MGQLAARIREILPTVADNAGLAERECSVPEQNITLLKDTGFFRALQPAAWGGNELPIPEYAECIVMLAQSCASTAWASGLLANHAHAMALFDSRLQAELWQDTPDTRISSSVAPFGQWQPAEGGITLSGRFGWSSGCDHAQWAVLGYMGHNDMGQPGPCFAVVPAADFHILDDWDAAALRGTGSKTIVVEQAFVPDYRTESLFALNYGLSRGFDERQGGLYFLPFSSVFSLAFSAVAVGIARRMTTVFSEKTRSRIRAYTGARVKENTAVGMRLAESVNQTHAALTMLRHDWHEMDEACRNRKLPGAEQVLHWRVNQAYAVKLCVEAVDRLFAAAGGSAWFNSNEMQRLFRDVHICASHAQTDYDMAAQTFGRHLLDLPADSNYY